MNRDRQTKSSHPVQRLNTKQAAPGTSNKRPAGDVYTYRDSKGQVITEDDEKYDDRPIGQMPRSSLRRSSFMDAQTEEQRKLVLTPTLKQQALGNLPGGVTWVRGIPCVQIDGYWTKVEFHEGDPEDFCPPTKPYAHRDTEALAPAPRQRLRIHWMFFIGIAAFLMISGWFFIGLLTGWVGVKRDDMLYGRPRTFQTDAVVGHNDSSSNPSHFQCINLDRRVQVIEFPGGDSSKAKVYLGPTLVGPGQDLTPCTLVFEDVNGDGKLDMILSIGGAYFVMMNDGNGFRPAKPGEHMSVQGG